MLPIFVAMIDGNMSLSCLRKCYGDYGLSSSANEAKSVAKANWDCSDGLLIRGYALSTQNIAEIYA